MRPTKPKYDDTWNSDVLLEWAEKLGPAESLSLKELTFKLACLLALATAQRVQTLSLIKISNIVVTKTGVRIRISDPIKTSRVGAPQPCFTLPFFVNRKTACVASVLTSYIERTKEIRGETDHLLITFKKPFHRATSQSISRWIRQCLLAAGVNEQFTAHCTRHAATSSAEVRGIDLAIIKSTTGWSERSKVFAKFYKRPINGERSLFVTSVLGEYRV